MRLALRVEPAGRGGGQHGAPLADPGVELVGQVLGEAVAHHHQELAAGEAFGCAVALQHHIGSGSQRREGRMDALSVELEGGAQVAAAAGFPIQVAPLPGNAGHIPPEGRLAQQQGHGGFGRAAIGQQVLGETDGVGEVTHRPEARLVAVVDVLLRLGFLHAHAGEVDGAGAMGQVGEGLPEKIIGARPGRCGGYLRPQKSPVVGPHEGPAVLIQKTRGDRAVKPMPPGGAGGPHPVGRPGVDQFQRQRIKHALGADGQCAAHAHILAQLTAHPHRAIRQPRQDEILIERQRIEVERRMGPGDLCGGVGLQFLAVKDAPAGQPVVLRPRGGPVFLQPFHPELVEEFFGRLFLVLVAGPGDFIIEVQFHPGGQVPVVAVVVPGGLSRKSLALELEFGGFHIVWQGGVVLRGDPGRLRLGGAGGLQVLAPFGATVAWVPGDQAQGMVQSGVVEAVGPLGPDR